jgi:hypothetical protein
MAKTIDDLGLDNGTILGAIRAYDEARYMMDVLDGKNTEYFGRKLNTNEIRLVAASFERTYNEFIIPQIPQEIRGELPLLLELRKKITFLISNKS